ncbi:hypothetical protein GCM10025876_09840 [Demequina litorisediminis]|uniref:Uncharacterized protein n=1 Tax=Demequina litorisediminis TaxID=1849022 RepID=A0ABQ6IAC8_9MICO|nr:hypothetical protein GCM10025876_09840 [Demequina litorisediminis]
MSEPRPTATTAGALEALRGKIDEAVASHEAVAAEKQHARGKKTARERIAQAP